MKVKAWIDQGLWPYTPDPGPVGMQVFGSPVENGPIILVGNSRHTLGRCRRILSPNGARILALDTKGMDLTLALKSGNLSIQSIAQALSTVDNFPLDRPSELATPPEKSGDSSLITITADDGVNKAEAEPGENGPELETVSPPKEKRAFLYYPVWAALVGEQTGSLTGWQIEPGPANVEDWPAFMTNNCQLTEEMKTIRHPLDECLKISLAQAGFFLLVAAVPMILSGWSVLAVGSIITLMLALLLALLQPWVMRGKRSALKSILLIIGISIGAFFVGQFVNLVIEIYILIATILIGAWFFIIFTCQPFRSSLPTR